MARSDGVMLYLRKKVKAKRAYSIRHPENKIMRTKNCSQNPAMVHRC
ncbi:hypothetical protein [Piscirickettsia salmonis]|nr:hypothetical protein [Piscirickettsia salmonis]